MPKKLPDLIPGTIVNSLTILEKVYVERKGGGRRATYKCQCVCGKIVNRGRHELATKSAKSCGCQNSQVKKWKEEASEETAYKRQYKNYKRAEAKDILFKISLEDFKEIVSQNCTYCGLAPEKKDVVSGNITHTIFTNGIDRVIPEKGYIKSNCVPCCKYCNRAKSDRSLSDFLSWAKRVVDKQEGSETSRLDVDSSESKQEEP